MQLFFLVDLLFDLIISGLISILELGRQLLLLILNELFILRFLLLDLLVFCCFLTSLFFVRLLVFLMSFFSIFFVFGKAFCFRLFQLLLLLFLFPFRLCSIFCIMLLSISVRSFFISCVFSCTCLIFLNLFLQKGISSLPFLFLLIIRFFLFFLELFFKLLCFICTPILFLYCIVSFAAFHGIYDVA